MSLLAEDIMQPREPHVPTLRLHPKLRSVIYSYVRPQTMSPVLA